ncbi:MAG: hypothetical protein ACI31V_00050 [Bacilli bacterium]
MKEKTGEERIFIGDIGRCTGVRRNIVGKIEGFGTVDTFGSMEIDSDIYKNQALLVEVDDDKYVDINYFTCFDDLRKVMECVANNVPFDDVILNDLETRVGKLFVDPTSLISLADTVHNFVYMNEKTTKNSYTKRISRKKIIHKKNKLLKSGLF